MEIKILQVFYGQDGLPYKDQARTIHFPITGSGFVGANNTTAIRFYYDQIGGSDTTWVAVSKLPNGKIGSKVISTAYDSVLGENYALFEMSSYYTQYKGDVFISLQGYAGGVNYEYNEDDDLYEIYGTPTIRATGSIKFAINYATQFIGSGEEENVTLQQIFGELSKYLKIVNGIAIINSETADISGYADQQIFYDIYWKHFYKKVDGVGLVPYDLVPYNQASVSIIIDPTHNINGRGFEHYTVQLGTYGSEPNQYQAFKLLYDGNTANEEQARDYMAYMTGSNYLPQYNLDKPANTYFLQPDGTILKPQYDILNGLLLIIMPKLAMQSWVSTNYVPYTGATNGVNLGNNDIISNGFYLTDGAAQARFIKHPTAGNTDVLIDSLWGDLILSADGIVKYLGYEIANKNYAVPRTTQGEKVYGTDELGAQMTYDVDSDLVGSGSIVRRETSTGTVVVGTPTSNTHATTKQYVDNAILTARTLLQGNINASGHSLSISGGSTTDYTYTITLKDKNNNSLSSITFDLPLESVVVSGTYDSDTQSIVLTLQDGSEISVPIGDLIDGLVSQSDFNDLSDTVTNNYNASVKYTDINVSGGYVTELTKNGVNYPLAEDVTLYTIPKVVQSTADLPATNDGYLYLVLDNGYLYTYENGAWTQAYQYVQDVSNFVQTSRTIAGIDLANDISAQALTDALVFMNNTTDLDYVMED